MGGQALITTYLKDIRCQTGVKWAITRTTFGSKSLKTLLRRGAGVVERGGLENRCALAYPGFESLSLRHFFPYPPASLDFKPAIN
jgi:hypothetical protein